MIPEKNHLRGNMGFLSFRWEGSNIPDKILFREHSTWQGIIYWRETGKRQAFRSFLEMVILMASALESGKKRSECEDRSITTNNRKKVLMEG